VERDSLGHHPVTKAAGETPPAGPEDLRKSFFTRRRRDFIEFDYADSGKTVYIAVQIESPGGKQGAWGPMISAMISAVIP
jgi:hypothetical protein